MSPELVFAYRALLYLTIGTAVLMLMFSLTRLLVLSNRGPVMPEDASWVVVVLVLLSSLVVAGMIARNPKSVRVWFFPWVALPIQLRGRCKSW
jgi:hypothetical protein